MLAEKYKKIIFPLWLAGDIDTPNWEMFTRTQHEDVRQGKLPSEKFFLKLDQYAPRKSNGGNDVTGRSLSVPAGTEMQDTNLPQAEHRVRASKVYEILPPPFDWIEIPSGVVDLVLNDDPKITLDRNHTRGIQVQSFAIGKYPITNAQFNRFLLAGGYTNREFWTREGWNAPKYPKWQNPDIWQNVPLHYPNHPVVGVSWYEAIAFCNWLKSLSGEIVMLPTEQQWQKAAQGDDKRLYPWSNEWDCKRCNNSVSPCKNDDTTPVTQYAGRDKGDSIFGVSDMVGNVWEWCRNTYYTGTLALDGTEARVLRGGSHYGDRIHDFRVDFRTGQDPDYRGKMGFRLALASWYDL